MPTASPSDSVSHGVEPTTSVSTNVTTPDGTAPAPSPRRRHIHGAGRPLVRARASTNAPMCPFGSPGFRGVRCYRARRVPRSKDAPHPHLTSPSPQRARRGTRLEVLQVRPPGCHSEPPHPGTRRKAAGPRFAGLFPEVATARRFVLASDRIQTLNVDRATNRQRTVWKVIRIDAYGHLVPACHEARLGCGRQRAEDELRPVPVEQTGTTAATAPPCTPRVLAPTIPRVPTQLGTAKSPRSPGAETAACPACRLGRSSLFPHSCRRKPR